MSLTRVIGMALAYTGAAIIVWGGFIDAPLGPTDALIGGVPMALGLVLMIVAFFRSRPKTGGRA